MFDEISELRLAQADGGLPTVVAAGSAPGAATTGFADQSHLSRWVRRVHGLSPTELTARVSTQGISPINPGY
jgi:transcriptional regulator GlxA family with amidase domain